MKKKTREHTFYQINDGLPVDTVQIGRPFVYVEAQPRRGTGM